MVRHMAGHVTIVSHYLLSEQIMDRVAGAAKASLEGTTIEPKQPVSRAAAL
jgi:hypothetical protein